MFFPVVGLGEPLVTVPTTFPAVSFTGYPWRAMPRPVTSKPTSLRVVPAALTFSSAARPTNRPFSNFTVQPSAASSGLVVSSMSLP
jgi:hypothetical protein